MADWAWRGAARRRMVHSRIGLLSRRHGGGAYYGSSENVLPCRHGRVLRVGGGAVRPVAEGEAGRGRGAGQRAGGGVGGIVCGAEVRGAFGDAAAYGIQAVSAGDLRRRASGAV